MKFDLELGLFSTFGAALLVWGGAFLRGAFVADPHELPPEPGAEQPGETPEPNEATSQSLNESAAEMSTLREELAVANEAREAQRVEMVEQRQRSERQVQGAQAEIQRLAAELEAEKTQAQSGNEAARDLRAKLASVEDELKKARGNTATAPSPAALQKLQDEAAEAHKKLKTTGEERDAAQAKVEALERLVEGVRARSRELAEELKTLKGA